MDECISSASQVRYEYITSVSNSHRIYSRMTFELAVPHLKFELTVGHLGGHRALN